jgi:hypothetical protein
MRDPKITLSNHDDWDDEDIDLKGEPMGLTDPSQREEELSYWRGGHRSPGERSIPSSHEKPIQKEKISSKTISFDKTNSRERKVSKKPLLTKGKITLAIIAALGIFLSVAWNSYKQSQNEEKDILLIKRPSLPWKEKTSLEENLPPDRMIYGELKGESPPEKVEHLLQEPEEPIMPAPAMPEDFVNEIVDEANKDPLPENPSQNDQNQGFHEDSQSSQDQNLTSQNKSKEGNMSDDPSSPFDVLDESPSMDDSKNTVDTDSPSHKNQSPSGRVERKNIGEVDHISHPSHDQNNSQIPEIPHGKALVLEKTHMVQLGSLLSQEDGEKEWKRLKNHPHFKKFLSPLKPQITRIDMGEPLGLRYRLQAGLVTKEQGKNICKNMQTHKAGCMVRKAPHHQEG